MEKKKREHAAVGSAHPRGGGCRGQATLWAPSSRQHPRPGGGILAVPRWFFLVSAFVLSLQESS